MNTLWQDLRYSLRVLSNKTGFSLIALIILALGIGLNTAIFSVVNSILLRPLPYAEPQQLVQVWETFPQGEIYSGAVSANNILDLQREAQSIASLSAMSFWLYTLTGTEEPTEIPAIQVSANFFTMLGTAPELGRTFLPGEDQVEQSRVVVLSHGFWQRRFGGSAQAIGQTMKLDDGVYTIIGVLPRDFRQSEFAVNYTAELWTPLTLETGTNRRGNRYRVIGRLQPNVRLEAAQAEMTTLAEQLARTYPDTNAGRSIRLVPLHEQVTGHIRWGLLVLQFATGFVLLIACANIAHLLLARLAAREKEMAIRSALGAGRWQLMRLLLSEGLALAIPSGILGFLLAVWGIDLLVALAPKDIPRLDEIGVDGRVFIFAILTSFVTILCFGLVPALQATKINLTEALKESGRSTTTGRGLRSGLVVAEVALTFVLLVGSGLLLRSLISMSTADLGFNPAQLLTVRVSLLESKYPERRRLADYYEQLLARLGGLPDVESIALTSNPPMIKLADHRSSFQIEGQPTDPGHAPTAKYTLISRDYFRTMETPLLTGRFFDERDQWEAQPVMIVNENFARRYFANTEPLGKKILIGRLSREIVGVVGNIHHETPQTEEEEKIYVPHTQNARGTVMLIVRSTTDPNRLIPTIQKTIWENDPEAAVSTIATMEQVFSEVIARPRFNAVLLTIFSLVALILAAVGIYGVMSYLVTQHTREIGIRMALGAKPWDVLKIILGQGLLLTLFGIGIGIIGALGLMRLLQSLLFAVQATDPMTFLVIAILLTGIALLACWIPAWRATKVDPMVALRYE